MGIFDFCSPKRSIVDSGFLNGVIDRHTHILYGVDDGIKTLEDSIAVLDLEESLGVKEVWCTPHIMEDLPNTTEFLKRRFEELSSQYNGSIKLHLAAEYMLDTLFEKRLKTGDLLTMEDRMVLIETSTISPPYDLKGSLSAVLATGYRPIFAHPERCRFLEVKDCEELVEMGVKLQLNLASLTGYYGTSQRVKAELILSKDLYSVVGSDCHRLKFIEDVYYKRKIGVQVKNALLKLGTNNCLY